MSEVGVGSDVPRVAGTLLQARTAAGLSQREVADALFLTVDMITLIVKVKLSHGMLKRF